MTEQLPPIQKATEFIRDRYPIEHIELIPQDGPLIVVANHPYVARLLPYLATAIHHRNDLAVVSDAFFTPIIKLTGAETIGVHISLERKIRRAASRFEEANMRVINILGTMMRSYTSDGSQNGTPVIDQIVHHVANGHAVGILPSGRSHQGAPWLRGIGASVNRLIEDNVPVSLCYVHFPRDNNHHARMFGVLNNQLLDGFIQSSRDKSDRGISHLLQMLYESMKVQGRRESNSQ